MDIIGSVFDVTRQRVECMDYAVRGGHGRLGEIDVGEFDCVKENNIIGYGI